MGILDDLDTVEVKITIKPEDMAYTVETETIELGVLYAVLRAIVRTIEDGSFLEDEDLNIWDKNVENDA